MYGSPSGSRNNPYGPGVGRSGRGVGDSPPSPGSRQVHPASFGYDQGDALRDRLDRHNGFRNRLRDDMNSFQNQYDELAMDGPLESPVRGSHGRDGDPVNGPRNSNIGLGGGGNYWRDTSDGGLEDDEDGIMNEGNSRVWPSFGGARASDRPGSQSRDPPRTGFPEMGNSPFSRGSSPLGGRPPFRDDFPIAGNDFHNTYGEYDDYNTDWDNEIPSHGQGNFGSGDGLGFDPEFLDGAIGEDENLDDIISRMMDAQAARGVGGAPPASSAAIANLKKKRVDRSMLDAEGKAECSVCMETVGVGEEVTELPCKIWFHEACCSHWLSSHDTCPHCRESITPKDTVRDPGLRGGPQTGRTLQYGVRERPQLYQHHTVHDDEAFARSLQDESLHTIHEDEALARMLQEHGELSVHNDAALARRLQEQSRPSMHNDAALARLLQEESELPVHDDESMARRLQEESELPVRDDEAMARRLQEEADHEDDWSPRNQQAW